MVRRYANLAPVQMARHAAVVDRLLPAGEPGEARTTADE